MTSVPCCDWSPTSTYTADNGPHSALYEDSKQVLGPTAVPSRCRDRMNRIPVSASGTSDSCSLCTSPLYRHRHAHQFSRQFPQGGYNSEGGGFKDFFRTSNLSSPDVFRRRSTKLESVYGIISKQLLAKM